MKNTLLNLQFLFMPGFWLMNDRYNAKLDKFMNDLMDKHTFKDAGKYTAKLGNYEIWIANRPYACMIPEDLLRENVRPSRLTVLRGIRKLKREVTMNLCDLEKEKKIENYISKHSTI